MTETVSRFEDPIARHKARSLTKAVYQLTKQGNFAKGFDLTNQIQRASVSVTLTIAKGFERRRRAEFRRFLSVAKAFCAEVRSQLYVALDVGYLQKSSFDALLARAEEVSRSLGGQGLLCRNKKEHGKP